LSTYGHSRTWPVRSRRHHSADQKRSLALCAAAVHLTMTAAAVQIRIADEGPGIPEEMLERVFEPYVRADLRGCFWACGATGRR
jgi:signal transduction histidine kinase